MILVLFSLSAVSSSVLLLSSSEIWGLTCTHRWFALQAGKWHDSQKHISVLFSGLLRCLKRLRRDQSHTLLRLSCQPSFPSSSSCLHLSPSYSHTFILSLFMSCLLPQLVMADRSFRASENRSTIHLIQKPIWNLFLKHIFGVFQYEILALAKFCTIL